jgi:hypothetical protein
MASGGGKKKKKKKKKEAKHTRTVCVTAIDG